MGFQKEIPKNKKQIPKCAIRARRGYRVVGDPLPLLVFLLAVRADDVPM